MLVAAPGLLSTMNDWPVRSDRNWPIRRATMSLPPAGAKPTTQRTGRFGQACAAARLGRSGSVAAPVTVVAARCSMPRRGSLMASPFRSGNCRQTTKQHRRDVGTLYAIRRSMRPPLAGVFRSLKGFNYRVWAAGAFVSNIGTWVQRTGQDWLVFTELTDHDAFAVSLVMALQ